MLVVQAYIILPEKINIFRFKWEDQISYQETKINNSEFLSFLLLNTTL